MKWSNAKLCDVVLRTRGARGMSRLPAFDFGGPIVPQASARCRTWIMPASRSTSDHRSPRNSLSRIPVKIAVTINGRRRAEEFSMRDFNSAIVGKSTPARSARAMAIQMPKGRAWSRFP